jgi:SWI/SNF-related matrix-associated actin-dependent regulator 1 of chromatin subfamily A
MTLPLLPYQKEGAAWLMKGERVGLFDVPGLGKTAQAIAALDHLRIRRALVICPASVRGVWPGEFKKFAALPRKILRAATIHDVNIWKRDKADVLLVSYEQANNWREHLEGDIIPAVILDEAHMTKNHSAKRTKAILGNRCDGVSGIARWGARVWFLTGTPMANDPSDLWTWMRFCGATDLPLAAFTVRYFNCKPGAFNMSYSPRKEMVDDLKQRIRQFSIRRTKEQAGVNLPPVWLTTQTVEGDTSEIRQLLREVPGLDSTIVSAVERGGLSFLDAQHIGTLRRLVGTAKAPAYAAQLLEELETHDDKVVVIGIHRDVLDILAAALTKHGIGFVRLDGHTPAADREGIVAKFQTDPDVRVFLGNIKAAGTGLTLTSAFKLDMLEWSWAPADNSQALMRVHRIGQEKEVHARFISLGNSVDERVSAVVARKTAAIAAIEGPSEYKIKSAA